MRKIKKNCEKTLCNNPDGIDWGGRGHVERTDEGRATKRSETRREKTERTTTEVETVQMTSSRRMSGSGRQRQRTEKNGHGPSRSAVPRKDLFIVWRDH